MQVRFDGVSLQLSAMQFELALLQHRTILCAVVNSVVDG
jgi:hypothetical protein